MNQLERIKEIDKLIRKGKTGTVKKLANRLGVCERSIYRDLHSMKEIFNLIIEYEFELESYVYRRVQSNTNFIQN